MITQYFFLCLIHNTWWMVLGEWWNHILLFSLWFKVWQPALFTAVSFSDNKTNDSFTELCMWFFTTARTYLTSINNLILQQFSREWLEIFPFSLFICNLLSLLKFSSKLCFLSLNSALLALALGVYWQYTETKVMVPILVHILEVKLCITWESQQISNCMANPVQPVDRPFPKLIKTSENYLCTTGKCRDGFFSKTYTK